MIRSLFLGLIIALTPTITSPSTLRFCATYEALTAKLLDEGEVYWWSYRFDGVDHREGWWKNRVEYWKNDKTGSVSIVGEVSSTTFCVLSSGYDLELSGNEIPIIYP